MSITGSLRQARPEDAAALSAIYAPSVTAAVASFELVAPTAEEMAERLARFTALSPWLVCEVDGAVCGYAYASRHHERAAFQWALDSAVYVAASHHRRGIARALYTALFELLRLQGFYSVHAGITLPNPASVALHEALGFRAIGVYPRVGYKLGAWRDVGRWQLELRPRDREPAPPLGPAAAERAYPERWRAAFESAERALGAPSVRS